MTFTEKRHLVLPKPTKDDFRADRERILDTLGEEDVTIGLETLRTLYPLVQDAGYDVTVTLSPAQRGREIIRVEPGDTTGTLYGLALDIGDNGDLIVRFSDGHVEAVSSGEVSVRGMYGYV